MFTLRFNVSVLLAIFKGKKAATSQRHIVKNIRAEKDCGPVMVYQETTGTDYTPVSLQHAAKWQAESASK